VYSTLLLIQPMVNGTNVVRIVIEELLLKLIPLLTIFASISKTVMGGFNPKKVD